LVVWSLIHVHFPSIGSILLQLTNCCLCEGAYRAWSHLGGLDPNEIIDKSAEDLNPLTYVIENDKRWTQSDSPDELPDKQDNHVQPSDASGEVQKHDESGDTCDPDEDYDEADGLVQNPDPATRSTDSAPRKKYYYEPLPRQGLAHPFVQAVLLPWLGTDPSSDAVEVGLSTLRTWWQHRRKGESTSAVRALHSEQMRQVVDNYTAHFFKLAHFLIVNDGELPPRSLTTKWKHVSLLRQRVNKKQQKHGMKLLTALDTISRKSENDVNPSKEIFTAVQKQKIALKAIPRCCEKAPTIINTNDDKTMPSSVQQQANKSHIDKLHAAQRRILSQMNVDVSQVLTNDNLSGTLCTDPDNMNKRARTDYYTQASSDFCYDMDDNSKTPVVFVSEHGDVLIAMTIEGMTYPHCVNIVETVLRGRDRKEGRTPPIYGILDAVADLQLGKVLIKIDRSSEAKRIAFEAARNLGLVGYTARAKEMSIVNLHGKSMDFSMLNTAFDVVANTDKTNFFDWNLPCVCMSNIYARARCERFVDGSFLWTLYLSHSNLTILSFHRHKQMSQQVFDAFEKREKQVEEFMAGCAKKHGLPCNCGSTCRCKDCGCQSKPKSSKVETSYNISQTRPHPSLLYPPLQPPPLFHYPNSSVDPTPLPPWNFMMQQQIPLQDTALFQQQQQHQYGMGFHPQSLLNPFPPNFIGAPFRDGLNSWKSASNNSMNHTEDLPVVTHHQQSSAITKLPQPSVIFDQQQSQYPLNPFLPPINPTIFPDDSRVIATNPWMSAVSPVVEKKGNSEIEDVVSIATPHSSTVSNDAVTVVEFSDTAYPDVSHKTKAARNASLISNISGLTSIDWDNMPGFDVNVDYSEHIDPDSHGDATRRLSLQSVSLFYLCDYSLVRETISH
jgi:hypothetical protein